MRRRTKSAAAWRARCTPAGSVKDMSKSSRKRRRAAGAWRIASCSSGEVVSTYWNETTGTRLPSSKSSKSSGCSPPIAFPFPSTTNTGSDTSETPVPKTGGFGFFSSLSAATGESSDAAMATIGKKRARRALRSMGHLKRPSIQPPSHVLVKLETFAATRRLRWRVPEPAFRRYARAASLALLVALIAASAWLWRRPARLLRDPGLSVLLITIDTLRADALGCYGRAGRHTPWIDRLAAGGVRFERAHAHNVVTLPSHANILSGRYPLEHGVRDNAGFRFPDDVPTLATLLKQRGYRTGAFVSAFPLDSRFGLDRGFDVYDDRLGDPEAQPGVPHAGAARRRATVEAARALAGRAGRARRPSCWVHLYEPHFPYEPPEPFAVALRRRPLPRRGRRHRRGARPLLEPLLEAGRASRTLVVLTSDHGEALGRARRGDARHLRVRGDAARAARDPHAPALFEPRVVRERRAPRGHPARRCSTCSASSLPPGLPGASLLPLLAGGERRRRRQPTSRRSPACSTAAGRRCAA